MRGERREAIGLFHPDIPDARADELHQVGIGVQKPAAKADAVSNVDDLAGVERGEIGEGRALHQIRVDLGYAVDPAGACDRQMRHPDAALAVLVDQRHSADQPAIVRASPSQAAQEPVVDPVDELHMARQQRLEIAQRPGLQGFGHQRVVGVGEAQPGQVPSVLPVEVMPIHQEAHELDDRERGMRVVDLDDDLVGQAVERPPAAPEAAQDVLHRCADEEILLLEAQLAARRRGVAGVEHLRHALDRVPAREGADVVAVVERAQVELAERAGRPQPQNIEALRLVSEHRHVVRDGEDLVLLQPLVARQPAGPVIDDAAAESYGMYEVRARHLPGIAVAKPGVGPLDLPAVLDLLLEEAAVVAHAVSVSRQSQIGHAVEQARREPPEASVAERRIDLELRDRRQIEAVLRERPPAALCRARNSAEPGLADGRAGTPSRGNRHASLRPRAEPSHRRPNALRRARARDPPSPGSHCLGLAASGGRPVEERTCRTSEGIALDHGRKLAGLRVQAASATKPRYNGPA